MFQNKINKIEDVEYELLYNSLFGSPEGISVNRISNQKYVNFIVNPMISGNSLKIQSVELDKKSMTNVLQDKRAKVMEGILLNSSNFKSLFKNPNIARFGIEDNINIAVNYASKFAVMTQFMYANLKPQIQKALLINFANNVAILSKQKLISDDAVKFAVDYMTEIDKSFNKKVFKFQGKDENFCSF